MRCQMCGERIDTTLARLLPLIRREQLCPEHLEQVYIRLSGLAMSVFDSPKLRRSLGVYVHDKQAYGLQSYEQQPHTIGLRNLSVQCSCSMGG